MKIFKDHEKMLKHYDACDRMRKRYAKLFGFAAIVLVVIGIVKLIQHDYYVSLILIISAIMIAIAILVRVLITKRRTKKCPLYQEILTDLRNNNIIRELAKRGLKNDKIDCIADPNFSIKIGYLYNKNIYYSFKLYLGDLDYGLELTDKMYNIPADIFDRNLKKKYGKYKVKKVYGMTKNEFYDFIFSNIIEDDKIKNLNELCENALLEAR